MINPKAFLEAWYPASNGQFTICVCVPGPGSACYFAHFKGAEDGTEVLAEITEMLASDWISQDDSIELNKITLALQGLYR